jgi:hypothetical protein
MRRREAIEKQGVFQWKYSMLWGYKGRTRLQHTAMFYTRCNFFLCKLNVLVESNVI